ncbi:MULTISPECIES: hypothetical protein [Protofrankia]|uniref:Uncharacterized protein n=1 Tax=Protofrankia coriariae TaxID=1562887 RepID=A0ABR5F4J1_9ACTN|nr:MULTISPECIES: hypothetical protein [Protofrankia]KLL11568.1 hypothetical protein FrCorBMG51_11045 [Protofrankia coriariae]ONH35702.1 hypothetical protein BL254_10440 [Protofrankia sp. BMG5.30]
MKPMDLEEVLACADLVGRSGASGFEIGYLDDDPANPRWYAHAQYRGARLTCEDHPTPQAAADALAHRLLQGAQCRCGRVATTSPYGAVPYNATLINGQRRTHEQARTAGQCLWRRTGARWEPSCTAPPIVIKQTGDC